MSPRLFRILSSHVVLVEGTETNLFNESDKNDSSVTNYSEQEIVKWMFEDYLIRDAITSTLCSLKAKETNYKLEVKKPLLTTIEQETIGDIDAIIIPKNDIEKTLVIEFKRIKVSTLKNNKVKINKVSTTRNKGFAQIKKLCKFNYHRTYLGIIIEDDSRNVKSPNTLIRNSSDFNVESIFDINIDQKLKDSAGLFFILITQPTGEHFNIRYNFAITIDKIAQDKIQSDETTNRIKQLLSEIN